MKTDLRIVIVISEPVEDDQSDEAVLRGIYMASTMNAARAAVMGIKSLSHRSLTVNSLQEHAKVLPLRS